MYLQKPSWLYGQRDGRKDIRTVERTSERKDEQITNKSKLLSAPFN